MLVLDHQCDSDVTDPERVERLCEQAACTFYVRRRRRLAQTELQHVSRASHTVIMLRRCDSRKHARSDRRTPGARWRVECATASAGHGRGELADGGGDAVGG